MTSLVSGRPASLALLDFGWFRVNAGRDIRLQGFLIETDAGERILVDTGMPAEYATDPDAASDRDGLHSFGRVLELGAEQSVAGQLARLGLAPGDIDLVILTHGHIDHVGGLAEVAHAPIIVAAAERAEPRPLWFGDARPMAWPEACYVTLDGDACLGPGLEVLLCPGHSPGTLAVLVDLPVSGAVCLTSDVVSRPAEIDEAFAEAWDPPAARASSARLLAQADARAAWVVFGHCPAQGPTLTPAPHRYT